jgi:hypothetical protein
LSVWRDSLHDVTHLVFAAYQEQPSLAGQVAPNVDLLEGSLDALAAAGAALQHVTLYQGNKYYGAHLGPFKTPAREDDPRLLGPNFYYDQEDLLRLRAERDGFAFTIFRPEAVCGVATGNPMNLLTAIAVYANLCKHKNIPLRFPGPSRPPTCCTRLPTPGCLPAQRRGPGWPRALATRTSTSQTETHSAGGTCSPASPTTSVSRMHPPSDCASPITCQAKRGVG